MFYRILLTVFVLLGLQSCASVPGVVEPPKLSVQDVSLQQVSLTQGTAMIHLQLTNPNGFPLPLRGVSYGLNLNGKRVAQGKQTHQRNINARETVGLNIPVQLNLLEIVGLVPSILQEGRVQYDLQGAVDLPFISVPFRRSGGTGALR